MKLKKRNTIENILKKKKPLVCLTAYTKPIAEAIDKFVDIILVGDSLGPVLYGFESTREVTLEMMIQHAKAVVNNTSNACIIVDLPFGSYESTEIEAYKNAKKLLDESGACGVKLEGGKTVSATIRYLVRKGISVMGHLGMTPQSARFVREYKVYGRSQKERNKVIEDITHIEDAGVFAIVIEATIESLAKKMVKKANVPTIGIGACVDCSGQILVTEDLLGLTNLQARFVKKYIDLDKKIKFAVENFNKEVIKKKFPSNNYLYKK